MSSDLEIVLIRKGIGQMSAARHTCSRCSRTPLVGERLHRFESGRLLCELCLVHLPEEQRHDARPEQIRATSRVLRIARPA